MFAIMVKMSTGNDDRGDVNACPGALAKWIDDRCEGADGRQIKLRKAKINRQTFHTWKTGQSRPKRNTFEPLAKALGMTVEEIEAEVETIRPFRLCCKKNKRYPCDYGDERSAGDRESNTPPQETSQHSHLEQLRADLADTVAERLRNRPSLRDHLGVGRWRAFAKEGPEELARALVDEPSPGAFAKEFREAAQRIEVTDPPPRDDAESLVNVFELVVPLVAGARFCPDGARGGLCSLPLKFEPTVEFGMTLMDQLERGANPGAAAVEWHEPGFRAKAYVDINAEDIPETGFDLEERIEGIAHDLSSRLLRLAHKLLQSNERWWAFHADDPADERLEALNGHMETLRRRPFAIAKQAGRDEEDRFLALLEERLSVLRVVVPQRTTIDAKEESKLLTNLNTLYETVDRIRRGATHA